MRKLSLLVLMLCMAIGTAFAQMSDEQVANYAQQRMSAGAGKQQIAQELLSKGVSKEQIQRAYSAATQNKGGANKAPGNVEFSRIRRNNGETRPDTLNNRRRNGRRGNRSNNLQNMQNMGGFGNMDAQYGYDDYMDDEFLLDEEQEKKSKVFGHDIFRSKQLTFEPNVNVPIPANYVLAAGDEVILDVYGASQNSQKIEVAPDGTITIPKIGPVKVSGLTVAQAEGAVQARMGEHYQGSSIKVSVGQTHAIQVNVMGEVNVPGTYTLSAFSSVFNALYMAGGVTDLGTLRDIRVSRNGKVVARVDVYDFIIKGVLSGNIMLHEGDVILVGPYVNLVEISGSVKRPMIYEMKDDETLTRLLELSGGFTGNADRNSVRVDRSMSADQTVYNVQEWGFNVFKMLDQDKVQVDSVLNRYQNMVEVKGDVFKPGKYRLENVLTVSGLIKSAGGLLEDANTQRATIQRIKPNRFYSSITVNLDLLLKGSIADIPLQNEDILTIYSHADRDSLRYVSITGEVFAPGEYEYNEGETLEGLIARAGGMMETASLVNVELARNLINPSATSDDAGSIEVRNFTLKDGLTIEGETGFKLMPFDRVSVRRSPSYKVLEHVNVEGEVTFAGSYTLTNKEERLSTVLSRVGGFTERAALRNAQLIRKSTPEEIAMQRQLIQQARLLNDTVAASQPIRTEYNVGINLEQAMAQPGGNQDIILQDGDRIVIPTQTNVVRISGEVYSNNSVAFVPGKNYKYYINQAGGFTKQALTRRAYVQYANGQISRAKNAKIEPGCEIIVPKKAPSRAMANASMWVSLASAVTTTAAVLINVFKK